MRALVGISINLVALGTAIAPSVARGDDAACNEAYTDVQRLRNAGKLRAARERAVFCANDACSPTVRTDCAGWLEEVERATPSILVEARDAEGHELSDVRVEAGGESGGRLLTERLDGKALLLDPGTYVFRFGHQGRVLEQRAIVREGEKYRLLRVQFPPMPGHAGEHGSQRIPAASYVLGAIGVLGLTTFAVLATSGYVSEKKLRDTCGRTDSCETSELDSVRTRYLIADTALAVGVLSTTAAVSFWALSPSRSAARARPPLAGVPNAGLTVSGRF